MSQLKSGTTEIISLKLPPETLTKLREKATENGLTLEAYLGQLAEREARNGTPSSTSSPATFDEILAPVRAGFAESGASDDELDALFEEAREEVWREKQGPES